MNIECPNVYLELTARCNNHCLYCYNDSGSDTVLDNKQVINLIRELPKLKCNSITLSGGEPFLYPFLKEVQNEAYAMSINCVIITNGLLLSSEDLSKELESNTIQLTFDACNEVDNDALRGIGSYQHTIQLIQRITLPELKKHIRLRYNVNRSNWKSIPGFVALAKSLGVKYISIALLQPVGRGSDSPLALSFEKDAPIILKIVSQCHEIEEQNCDIALMYNEVGIYSCPYAKSIQTFHPAIDYNGNVYLCQSFRSAGVSVGNIYHSSLADALCGTESQSLLSTIKDRVNNMTACRHCSINARCTHGCPALNFRETQSFFNKDSQCALMLYSTLIEMKEKKRHG